MTAVQHAGQKVDTITLQNPVSQHFGPFIFGNATKCDRVVEQNSAKGQELVLCGAGPSLGETAAKWIPTGDQVWGCNSAATWLLANGHRCTHAFAVDQTPHMQIEWASAPDVEYLLASSVHPFLVEFLLAKERQIRFFHNYVGIKERPVAYATCDACDDATSERDATSCAKCGGTSLTRGLCEFEDWMYMALYPATVRAGSGLNAVTRAIDVALYMGFDRITVLGADCALRTTRDAPKAAAVGSPEHQAWLRDHTIMHADGGSALASEATPVTIEGEIDGRRWLTKPDMMISAVWLVTMKRKLGRQLRLMGDTLPKALMNKPDSYLQRLPTLTDSDGKPLPFF